MVRRKPSRTRQILAGATLALAFAVGATKGVVTEAQQTEQRQDNIRGASGGDDELIVTHRGRSGLVEFASARQGSRGIGLDIAADQPAEARALEFVRSYGKAFGIADERSVRVTSVHGADSLGIEHVRFQRLYRGVPVTAAEMTVHLRGNRAIAVNAKTAGELSLDVTPGMAAVEAVQHARSALEKQQRPARTAEIHYSEPALQVLDRSLLDEKWVFGPKLAWFIEATGPSVREYIWVDATTGAMLLHFSQLPDAKVRRVFTAGSSSTLPGTIMREEAGGPTGDADADAAYTYGGDHYDFFYSRFGRDSFDALGAWMLFTVHYCEPGDCPYRNAFWNGNQMVFGDNFSRADDVVGHELTHAVIEKTANLFYFSQSGALNEAYADIFGEAIDQTNGHGNDASYVRWQLGEDMPGYGAIRHMMYPHTYYQPDRVGDYSYYECSVDDGAGVHTNSGIADHAFALMTDGGSFNGRTITGIGLEKAARIHYYALVNYLTSGSNFRDHAAALVQSCSVQAGTHGITNADCAQVQAALDAVEMNGTAYCSASAPQPAACPAGTVPYDFFNENFETPGTWWQVWGSGAGQWGYVEGWAKSGKLSAYGTDPSAVSDRMLVMGSGITLPSNARLQFNHAFYFEDYYGTYYDGGVIEYSLDNGATWSDARPYISGGLNYQGTLSGGYYGNPLGYRYAFAGPSDGYVATQLNLSTFAGRSFRLRFRVGTDSSGSGIGWVIDDFRMYSCGLPTAQAISVATHAPATVKYGRTFTVGATATSGLPVVYSSGSPSVCTAAGANFTMTAPSGTCIVQYDQPGAGIYGPAPRITESVAAQKGTAALTIGSADVIYDGTAKAATVTTSPAGLSGVVITYNGSTTPPVATGSYAVVASLTNANYDAQAVSGTLNIVNPAATITGLSPSQALVGSGGTTVTIYGANFVGGATAFWNGSARETTVVSTTQLQVALLQSDFASAGVARVSVVNPAPAVGASPAALFTIGDPLGTIATLSPRRVKPGYGAFTLTVRGGAFTNGATVLINGAPRATSYVSDGELSVSMAGSDVAAPGRLQVTVRNPGTPAASAAAALIVGDVGPDFDGDGNDDLVWRNRTTGALIFWMMKGAVRASATSVAGHSDDPNWRVAAVADFNGDDRPDLVWRNTASGANEVWYMNGTTRVGTGVMPQVPDGRWQIAAAADFNGDAKPDIVWRNGANGDVVIWYMNGTAYASWATVSSIPDANWQIAAVDDFNGDGKHDLLWHNQSTGQNLVWYMNGGAYSGYAALPAEADTQWAIVGTSDVNGDGNPDIVWHHRSTGENRIWYMNDGTQTGSDTVRAMADPQCSPIGTADGGRMGTVGDFNADATPDILWRNGTTGENLVWYLRPAAGTPTAKWREGNLEPEGDLDWSNVAVADFNRDGLQDVVWRNRATGENTIWLMAGTERIGSMSLPTIGDANWRVVGVGDFNQDGHPDLAWRNYATGANIIWFLRNGEYLDWTAPPTISDTNWKIVAVGDFNGDGWPDLFWRNESNGVNIAWFLVRGVYSGWGQPPTIPDPSWQIVGAGDYNADGKADLLWRNRATGQNLIWYLTDGNYLDFTWLPTLDVAWRTGVGG